MLPSCQAGPLDLGLRRREDLVGHGSKGQAPPSGLQNTVEGLDVEGRGCGRIEASMFGV